MERNTCTPPRIVCQGDFINCTHPNGDYCTNCVDLNDPPYVNKYSPHRAFKDRLLQEFARRFNLRVFVETGTCRGEALDFLQNDFRELHSIELQPDLYEYAVTRFRGKEHIHLVHGNSAKMLAGVLEKISEPCLLFVDAHVAGTGTADEGDPVEMELQAIYEKCPTALVVIDDRYPEDLARTSVPDGWTKRWYHGLIFLHKQGLYAIPDRY